MASKKPPNISQPTSNLDNANQPDINRTTNMSLGDENGAEIPSAEGNLAPILIQRVHPVNFEVTNSGNAVSFLSLLLTSLQQVDSTAVLLPHPEATSEFFPLSLISEIPTESSEKKMFVLQYLSGLRATNTAMKGKFWLSCQANFSTFKKNATFKAWMAGSKDAPRIVLDRTDLPGVTRHPVGIFLNVIARSDLEINFAERTSALFVATCPLLIAPPFQIEAKPIYMKDMRTRVYRMLASSKEDVVTLKEMMAMVIPRPSVDVSFIPYSVWESLPSPKKKQYLDMQQSFESDHNAMLFRGVINHQLKLVETINKGYDIGEQRTYRSRLTIIDWIYNQASADNSRLFYKVYSTSSGEIEIWHNRHHEQEARAWLKSALTVIARLSGIDFVNDRVSAAANFLAPDNIWKTVEANFLGKSLLDERKSFIDFSPPVRSDVFKHNATSSTASVQSLRKKKTKDARPRKLALVFDIDDVESVLSTEKEVQSTSSSKRSRKSKAKRKAANAAAKIKKSETGDTTIPHVTVEPEREEAKKKADLALAVAVAALKKDPTGSTPGLSMGEYYMIHDEFGHAVPVVYINNKAVPLTAATLKQSRKTTSSGTKAVSLKAQFAREPSTPSSLQQSQLLVGDQVTTAAEQAIMADISRTWRAPLSSDKSAGVNADKSVVEENMSFETEDEEFQISSPQKDDSIMDYDGTAFTDVDSGEYRDNGDFEDELTEVSDKSGDNRSQSSTISWAKRLVSGVRYQDGSFDGDPSQHYNNLSPHLDKGRAGHNAKAETSVSAPSSLQKAAVAPCPPSVLRKSTVTGPSQKTGALRDELPEPLSGRPAAVSVVAQKLASLRKGHQLQLRAVETRHKAESEQLHKMIESFQAQIHALVQHNKDVAAKSLSDTSSTTSTDVQDFSSPPRRRSIKSGPLQRTPPKDTAASASASKRVRTSGTTSNSNSNRYAVLDTAEEEDEEETFIVHESMVLAPAVISSIEETTNQVRHLSLKKPPASGSNGAAGRPLPDEEVLPSTVSTLRHPTARQQTLFQYCVPSLGRSHERGLSKTAIDFDIAPTNSVLWGDPHASGEEVEQDGLFRVLSHNVNGLSTANDHIDVRNMAGTMKTKSVAVFGLQETNRNFERTHMLQSFHRLVKRASVQHKGTVSSAKLQWPSDYQPGGTAVSVRNQWATRFLDKGSDDLGRWSWLTLAGRGTTQITFISGYRVCDGAHEAPVTARTVRAQQEWMYADRGLATVNLREQFVTDMCALIQGFQAKGHDIILMFDANEACGQGTGVDRLIHSCGLVDAHSMAKVTSQPPATYQRGSMKIDFVLISPRITCAVRAASILPLHDGYLSDHRALVVDFDAVTLFAGTTSPVLAPKSRRLTSTNSTAVHLYITEMRRHIALHCLAERVDNLQVISESGVWTELDVATWESIDLQLDLSRRAAERRCKPINSGNAPWSPELDSASKLLLYWTIRVREFSSGNTNHNILDSLADALDISQTDRAWLPSALVRQKCRRAKKALKLLKLNSLEIRAQHLIASAKLAATLHHMSEAAAVSAISAREKSSRQFKQLRSIFNRGQASGFDRIDIPDVFAVLREGEQTPRIPLVVKEQIEEVLLPHTEQRFRQHRETPFGHGVRQEALGFDCTSDDVQAILSGTYDRELESLSEEAREWLRQLRVKDFVNGNSGVISTNISTEDWVSGWARMRECTASAPGSGHYGHYKTASVAARLPEDHPDHLPILARIYAAMWSMPLRHGFSPKRWRSCVDAIIEKIPGKPMIEKLRIIMLYEADFNFVLKLIWGKRLVANAEKYKCLGISNHGSRAGRQTIDALMEKLLIYEIARLTRTSVVTVDNDAKSCYDRIIKTLSMIACMGVGLPLAAAVMHNKTHHGMVHSIKSSHGLLRPYSGSDSDELEGSGQGSGASPAIWLIYCVSLLEAFRRFTTGISIPSPFEEIVVRILAIFFVDDGMPGVNDAMKSEAEKLSTLLQQAEDCSQSWERLLFASGGALELTKCFTYIIYWDLSGGEHRILDPSEIPGCEPEDDHFRGPLCLTYGQELTAHHKIVTESPWTGRRTLGVRIAPAGNWSDEAKFRSSQSRDLAILLSGSTISRETARVGYRSMVCPKLEFPLAVTQFTQKECDRISSPILRVCLSKMGFNCNMPREVVYGPLEMGGLGMHDYYIEQGIAQITTMVGHVRQDSETARLLAIELQWCQVQAGTAHHLLECPNIPIDYVEACWIMTMRNFLCTYNLRLNFTDKIQQYAHCHDDEFIMDALRCRGDCTSTELQRLNACRMTLKVVRLSDITEADGMRLHADVLAGKDLTHFRSKDRWPRQGRPPKPWWNLWRRKLKLVFSRDGTTPQLRTKLGAWDNTAVKMGEWSTLVSTGQMSVCVYRLRDDGRYDVLTEDTAYRRRGRTFVRLRQPSNIVDAPSQLAVPAGLGKISKHGRYCVTFRDPRPHTPFESQHEASLPSTLAEYVDSQPGHIRRLLQHCDLTDATAIQVVDLVYSGNALDCGTDGGLIHCLGTFGYVWGNPGIETSVVCGKGHVEGSDSCMSSTRTEMCGILGTLTYLRLVLEHFHVVSPRVGVKCTIYCDSQAALRRMEDLSFDGFGTTWRCRENYDIEAAVRQCLLRQRFSIKWEWIRGHAIRRKTRDRFSRAEHLNDEADELATAARSDAWTRCDDHWPEQRVSVVGPLGRLGGRLSHEIRYHCTAPDMMSYWRDRYLWSQPQVDIVDNISTKAAMSTLRGDAASRIQKLRCGWLPINSRESRCDKDRLSGCSSCSTVNLVEETVDHIFQCNSPIRRKAILDRFDTLHFDFRKLKTAEPIISALLSGALAWVEGRTIPSIASLKLPDTGVGRLATQAFIDQSALGWNLLFRGFWATSWRLAQELQFSNNRSRERQDTGPRWAGKAQGWFIGLFEFIWGMRNAGEHGADPDMERLIRLAKCERAIRRLYNKGVQLPHGEQHPFRDPIDVLLQRSLPDQELWISLTEVFLPKAFKRVRKRTRDKQSAITDFFARQSLS